MKRISGLFRRTIDLMLLVVKGGVGYARYKGVTIGKNCRVFTTRFGTEPFLVSLGDNVTVTQGVTFLTHDGSTCLFRDGSGRRYFYSPIKVGSNVFIGVNTIIMPGVVIEDNVIVGAGAVVTRSVPQGKIVAGNPARIIGDFATYKSKALNEYFSDRSLDLELPYKERVLTVFSDRTKEYLK
jgi:acetyltransferase-like isoleucine patch superfamily enzyme